MNRADAILLVLASDPRGPLTPLVGTTRLQKLVFLAEREGDVRPEDGGFGYEPHKYGPLSRQLYDDIEFLVNLGYLEKSDEPALEPRVHSLESIEQLDASEFLCEQVPPQSPEDSDQDEREEEAATASSDSVVYKLSQKGLDFLREEGLLDDPESDAVRSIVRRYGRRSVPELLRYVYTRYGEFATESEIRDRVL